MDEAQDDARRFGFALVLPADPGGGIGIWEEFVPALSVFLAVDTQWRVAAGEMGAMRVIGLDYTAARAGLELAGMTADPDAWADVRVIESGAVEAMNERV